MVIGELAFMAVVLPAYAGMIQQSRSCAPKPTGAPRVCGDDPAKSMSFREVGTVLPAYAGMIL